MTALAWLTLTAVWAAIAYVHGRDAGREQMANWSTRPTTEAP